LVFTECMTAPALPGFVTFFDLPGDKHPVLCSFVLSAILFSVVCYPEAGPLD